MVYCGLDVAMVSSYLRVSDQKGNRLMSGPVPTEGRALRQRLGRFVAGGLKVARQASIPVDKSGAWDDMALGLPLQKGWLPDEDSLRVAQGKLTGHLR